MSSLDSREYALTIAPAPTGLSLARAHSHTASERPTSPSQPREIDGFLKHSLMLTLATGTMNAASWLYHLIMSRTLGPVDYGALSALIGLLLVLTVPVNTIHMGVSAYVARAHDQRAVLTGILKHALKGSLLAGASAFVAVALISAWVAKVLKLDSPVPVLVVGSVMIPWAALPILRGVLQGAQRFGALGLSIATEGALKLGAGVLLVTLGLGLSGAVGGVSVAALVALALTLIALRGLRGGQHANQQTELRELVRSLVPYAAAIGCFTVLTQADVVLVKALFPPHDAGVYAAASAGGKIVLYLTGALPMVMLPEMARRHATHRDGLGVLWRGLAYGGLAGGIVVAAYVLAPARILGLLFGSNYVPGAPLLAPLGLAMLSYDLALLGIYYELGMGRLTFLPAMGAVTVAFPVALWLLRGDVRTVAFLVAGLGLLTFAVVCWSVVRPTQRRGHLL